MLAITQPPIPLKFRKRIAEHWREFDELELNQIGDNAARLIQALQSKYGLSADEAARQARSFLIKVWNEHRQSEWLAS